MPSRKNLYLFLLSSISMFTLVSDAQASNWLFTQGPTIFNSDRTQWVAHGVNLPDMRSNSACFTSNNPNETIRRLDLAANWGANVIRIPMETWNSNYYQKNNQSDITYDPNYLPAIKQIVDHATAFYPNLMIMLSLWHDPTFNSYSEPTPSTDNVYNALVDTFYSYPNVIFGVDNEPLYDSNQNVWNSMNHAVQTIRSRENLYGGKPHLISIQSRNYSADASYYISNPITAGNGVNIIYETHIYDYHYAPATLTASASIPIIVGEYGPGDPNADHGYDWATPDYVAVNNNYTLDQTAGFAASCRSLFIPIIAWAFNECDSPSMLISSNNKRCGSACNANVSFLSTSWGQQIQAELANPYGALPSATTDGNSVDYAHSFLTPSAKSSVADGNSSISFNIFLSNHNNQALAGKNVTINGGSTGDSFSSTVGTTDSNGIFSFLMRSNTPGIKNIVASVDLQYFPITVTFTSLQPNTIVLTKDTDYIIATGVDVAGIHAHVQDFNGLPVSGKYVTAKSSFANDTLNSSSNYQTDSGGNVSFLVHSRTVGIDQISVNYGLDSAFVSLPVTPFYLPTAIASPNSAPADGNSVIWVNIFASTANGNPGVNQNIYFGCYTGGVLSSPASGQTDSTGHISFSVVSQIARQVQCEISYDKAQRPETVNMNFVPANSQNFIVPQRTSKLTASSSSKASVRVSILE